MDIKQKRTDQISYSGMMHAHDFKHWYYYLHCRLRKEWSAEDVAFLLGKPDYYYADFEKMYQVADFLRRESDNLTSLYPHEEPVRMAFQEDDYGYYEERLVRLMIEQGAIGKTYQLVIPWEFKLGKNAPSKPPLTFQEWDEKLDLLTASDSFQHIRRELEKLWSNGCFQRGVTSVELYRSVKESASSKMTIKPRHVKQAIYLLIQRGQVIVRRENERFMFYNCK